QTMKMAGLLVFINDVHSLGLKTTQGMYLTTGWYWDQSDAARAWAKKFEDKVKRKPSMLQAGDYSSVAFYLNGVKATGTDDGDAIMKWMKSNKINDFFATNGYVREDGRMIHDMYLMQVKTPEESKAPWDYYKVVATLPGDEVYTKPSESTCKLFKQEAADAVRRARAHPAGPRRERTRLYPNAQDSPDMIDLFGIPIQALLGQLLLGLVNGSFYAMLSLGLAVIFGLLNVINFAHGSLYMLGAFVAWMGLSYLGLNYWVMLILAPLVVGLFGIVIEKLLLKHLYKLDHLYGLLLTFGLTLLIEGLFRSIYGVSGQPYPTPDLLRGATNLGFMILPNYRGWVVVASITVCMATWFIIERTRLGALLRAGSENPKLVEAFGVNVPRMVTLTYGFGVALAGFAGVLAAPVLQISPLMGSNLIIVVFAVVVIGGMGSILGAIVTGLGLGVIEGLTKVFWPEASSTVVFIIMAIVLLLRPAGLFGKVK